MPTSRPEPFRPGLLRPTADLRRLGESPGDREEDGQPKWIKVRRGVVVRAATWRGLTPEQRHAALVHSTVMQMSSATLPTFSHTSAAALWRLPRVTAWPARVDVSISGGKIHSSGLVRRHRADVGEPEVIDGVPVTSLMRTLIDLARTEELPDAVAAADHALHHKLCTREELLVELDTVAAGARGRSQAALVVNLADAGAMSVGESLSRVQMFRLNIPRPRLQVSIEDDEGLAGVCDFWWEGVVGEFDGRMKYRVREGMSPAEIEQVLWSEKKREDRIRARDHKMARWVWADAARPMRMVAKLEAQGIARQARNTWFDAA
ncbi:hypothetical protein V6K52_04040 [Knoellia sp. S7-12]|uniref:hypothetical protein n=1 Tax=Knoellia sp. S7-12 TaxID=3126698 RepID=UPI0033686D89